MCVCLIFKLQMDSGQMALLKILLFYILHIYCIKTHKNTWKGFFFFFLRTGLIYQKIVFLIPSCLSLEPQGLGLVL